MVWAPYICIVGVVVGFATTPPVGGPFRFIDHRWSDPSAGKLLTVMDDFSTNFRITFDMQLTMFGRNGSNTMSANILQFIPQRAEANLRQASTSNSDEACVKAGRIPGIYYEREVVGNWTGHFVTASYHGVTNRYGLHASLPFQSSDTASVTVETQNKHLSISIDHQMTATNYYGSIPTRGFKNVNIYFSAPWTRGTGFCSLAGDSAPVEIRNLDISFVP